MKKVIWILVFLFGFSISQAETVRIYLKDGVTGCGTWCQAYEGLANGYLVEEGIVKFVACDKTQNICYEIGQDCNLGKWYIDIHLNGFYPQPNENDSWFEIYWDEETQTFNSRPAQINP